MRDIVEVDELSAEMLMNLKKNSRILHIFSLIDNTIALETENVGLNEEPCGKPQGINSHITNTAAVTLWQATGNSQVKELKGVKRVAV